MWVLALKASFGVVFLSLAAFGAGTSIAKLMPVSFCRLDCAVYQLLGGFGILSLVLFLVGQIAFTRTLIATLLTIALLAGVKPLWHLRSEIASIFVSRSHVPTLPLVIVLLTLSLTAVVSLSEITGNYGNDAVAYHLLGPKVWLRNGIVRPLADNCHTAFPQTMETLYGALLAIGETRAPDLLSVVTFSLLLLVSSSLARRCGLNVREAWWVAALVATMPAVYAGSTRCFVDGVYAAFVLVAARVAFDAAESRHWVLCGVFGGLAMGTKYTGLLALLALVFCTVLMSIGQRRENWQGAARNSGIVIAIAGVIAAPYYIRNWIMLGCPIYPPPLALVHFCSPRFLPPEAVAAFHTYIRQRGAGLGRGLTAFLLLPFNLTYHTSNFHGAGGIGLAPLALGPLGMISALRNTLVRVMGILGLLLLSMWFVTQQESRFLIHVYVIGAVFSVIGWRHAASSGQSTSRVLAGTIVAISVFYGLFMVGRGRFEDVRAAISPSFALQKRLEEVPFLEGFKFLNNESNVRKVLILNPYVPSYYLDKTYIKPFGQWGERTLPGITTSPQALEHLRELNVSHVLDVASAELPFQIVGEKLGLTLVFEARNQRVYQVNSARM